MHPVLLHIGSILIPAYGAVAALGVLLALMLALQTAQTVAINPNLLWNLCILALFAALAGTRILLVILNWSVLRAHPAWIFSLGMIHHPLVAAAGGLLALAAAGFYARAQAMPLLDTADALAPPVALGLALEQIGALMAGAGYGTETAVRWAVVYTHPLAVIWSGAPLGVPVHPVQAYAAIAFLTIAAVLMIRLPDRRQTGDVAGMFLMAAGAAAYLTEFFRDPEGRGVYFNGIIDGPQIAAVASVLAGALLLLERRASAQAAGAAQTKPTSTGNAEANENPHD